MLLSLHDFCVSHGLRYSLCGGTLLGAVRHKGFIPWDDDIDVFMPRPDYERLRNLAGGTQLIGNGYILVDYRAPGTDDGILRYPFLKLVDERTEVDTDGIVPPWRIGVWIDIFPVDGIPESAHRTRMLFRSVWLLRQIFSLHYCARIPAKSFARRIAKIPLLPVARLADGNAICSALDHLAQKYKYSDSQFVGCTINGYGPQEKLLKSDLEPMEMEFEGHSFFGIRGYDRYLTNLYGDYMQLPPENERGTGSHFFAACRLQEQMPCV